MQVLHRSKKMFRSALLILFSYFLFPVGVLAQDDYGLEDTAKKAGGGDIPFIQSSPAGIVGNIIGAALSFIGLLFFILMIYGGVTWMTAGGNQQQVDKAKSLITSAVIGLIIVMAAYAVTSFIGRTLT